MPDPQQITAADAKTYLSDFVDPKAFDGLDDTGILGMHKRFSEGVLKHAPKVELPKAPDKYELQFQDGVTLDPEAFAPFEKVLRQHNIPNAVAQELATAFVAELGRQDTAINELYNGHRETWLKGSKEHKELGGANFEANLKVAKRGMARFGSPALKTLLEETGLGDHPEFFAFFHKVGSTIKEDDPPINGGSGTEKQGQDLAKLLFDHPTSQHA